MIQNTQTEEWCRRRAFAAQQGIRAIEQATFRTRSQCIAIDTISLITLHIGVNQQVNTATLIVGSQFLSGQRLVSTTDFGSLYRIISEPQAATVLSLCCHYGQQGHHDEQFSLHDK